MKYLILVGFLISSVAMAKSGSHSVKGHFTKKGTYVKSHRQTNSNHTKRDNYSTKGNTNPYTGKKGTKKP